MVRRAAAATAAVKSVTSHEIAQLQVKVLPRAHHEAAEPEVVSEAASEVAIMVFRTTDPQTASSVVARTTMHVTARRRPSSATPVESWSVSCAPFHR